MDVTEDITSTLRAQAHHPPCVLESAGFCTEPSAKAHGIGYEIEISPTVRAGTVPAAIAYGIGRDAFNQGKNAKWNPCFSKEIQPTLVSRGPGAIQKGYIVRRLTPAECARLQGFPDSWCADLETENPTDEEVLTWQKIFDDYNKTVGKTTKPKTENQIRKWLKNPHSDSAEYKMWGNGVALPCVYFVLSGTQYCSQLIDE